ncbi:hypothetical protein [Bathymodiolus japonicus methanotrophic gill symbiont]|uniref:hypothetical protein n=1 Tax=Bathymodiolus japonicus methanotrophic gill symbiont TaxID=113269 RepID=UPI001C8E9E69|nr:hypothetical protein [Bathymodiolus japonicus methanotrophic gill symbiont]
MMAMGWKNLNIEYKVYKQKHKGSGGYVNGQTIVLLLLVTSSITVAENQGNGA